MTRCCIPINSLDDLDCVHLIETFFDEVRRDHRDLQRHREYALEDVLADNNGGPVPVGAWQFALYTINVPLDSICDVIKDPRGDLSYPSGETLYALCDSVATFDEACRQFTFGYAAYVRQEANSHDEDKCVVKRHPELFVVVDNDTPGEMGVLIVG